MAAKDPQGADGALPSAGDTGTAIEGAAKDTSAATEGAGEAAAALKNSTH